MFKKIVHNSFLLKNGFLIAVATVFIVSGATKVSAEGVEIGAWISGTQITADFSGYSGSIYFGHLNNGDQYCQASPPSTGTNTWDIGSYLDFFRNDFCNNLGENGVAYLQFRSGSTITAYIKLYYNVGTTLTSNIVNSNITRFISVSPVGTVSTTTNVGANLYITAQDGSENTFLNLHFSQDSYLPCSQSGVLLQSIGGGCEQSGSPPFDLYFGSTGNKLLVGNYNLSTSTTFAGGGKWTGTYSIKKDTTPWWYLGLARSYETILSTTTHFVIGTKTPMDIFKEQIDEAQKDQNRNNRETIGSILASTTARFIDACNFPAAIAKAISFGYAQSSFNIGDCLTLAFYPGNAALNDDFYILKEMPPWGYGFRIYDLLNATSSTSSLPIIDAKIPQGIPGAGSRIKLDLAHSLDPILNATTSFFTNESASSTATLFTITNRYWSILVYLGTALYIFSRLIGSHIVPNLLHKEGFGPRGALSDTSSSDDSYRLKEWLYKHNKK